jgi:spermidine synthase
MDGVPQLRQPGDVAAIGLGVGTLAAYVRPGQRWTFYEIDPAIERIARDDRYFTFLNDCGDRCRVVLGDARLSLAATAGARYQLIALDAFSSDAIPMHLLTREAMGVYLSRLAPHGVLAIHISNRHLRLNGLVGRLAAAHGLVARERRDVHKTEAWPKDKSASHWMVMARTSGDLGAVAQDPAWTVPPDGDGEPLWTDDFSNILDVLQVRLR